jgi:hypothetical protein
MTTITMTLTLDAAQVPAGAKVRLYDLRDNSFIGEGTSDGSGIVAMPIAPDFLGLLSVWSIVDGVEGHTELMPAAISVSVG